MYRAFQWLPPSRPPHITNVAVDSAATLLSLPRLDDAIPLVYAERDDVALIEMARCLAHAGIIRQTDRRTDRTLRQTLIDVMSRDINEVAGDMRTFDVQCHFGIGDDYHEHDIDGPCMTFYIYLTNHIPDIRLDAALAYLNTIHADLGQTLYAVMEHAAMASLKIHTFHSVTERFGYELQLDPDLREEIDEDEETQYYDVDAMALRFPFPWVKDAIAVLSPIELAAIASQKEIPADVCNALAAAIDIGNIYKEGAWQLGNYCDCPPVHALAMISLADHDPTEELVDEVINTANQCGDSYTINLHEQVIDVSDTGDFPADWHKIIAGFRLLNALDRLLTSLDKLNKEKSP